MVDIIDCIVKIGGSAITFKDQFETAKPDIIKDVANLIKQYSQAGLRCIIVHGAGSFGHHQAKEFHVKKGWSNLELSETQKRKTGFSLTRVSVLKLNHMVVDALVSQNIPAICQSPCGTWVTDNGDVLDTSIASLAQQVLHGFIPVLHGDCVFDKSLGGTILSGDIIIKTLCEQLCVKRVVFLCDVEGIYDRPPNEPEAQLLEKILVNTHGIISLPILRNDDKYDVTGGMELKLNCASQIVQSSEGKTSVFICLAESLGSALHAGLFGLFAEGEKGTIITFDE